MYASKCLKQLVLQLQNSIAVRENIQNTTETQTKQESVWLNCTRFYIIVRLIQILVPLIDQSEDGCSLQPLA